MKRQPQVRQPLGQLPCGIEVVIIEVRACGEYLDGFKAVSGDVGEVLAA
jgi:hypothetical protein